MIGRRQITRAGVALSGGLLLGGYHRTLNAQGNAQLIRVGATKSIKTIAQAVQLAKRGATIEVDAGEYLADVAMWVNDGATA